jgi:glycosyltransferase involved in cell wall biosynthesis
MRVVFFANFIPDPCGAFFHDVAIAKELQRRGHIVNFVMVGKPTGEKTGVYRGIQWKHYSLSANEMGAANIFSCPHFPFLNFVRKLNDRFQKPILVTMHFGEDTASVQQPRGKWAEMLWIVSEHIKNHIVASQQYHPSFKTVESVRPLMLENEIKFHERGSFPPGDCISMVNANLLKGLPIFIALAQRFPNRKFLGIRPYYNKINVPEDVRNIEWLNIQDDIRSVLVRTRIMLVPSMYESWGRVAFEAMYNGIPVLHTKPFDRSDKRARPSGSTEGMKEWIQGSQFECDFDNMEEWVKAITALDDQETYAEYSKKAYDRTYEMNVFGDFPEIERKLVEYANTYPGPDTTSKTQLSVQSPASALQIRMPPAGGSALPFRAGRFSVRR